jgi:hypothetical protein
MNKCKCNARQRHKCIHVYSSNGRVSDKPRRLPRHQRTQAHNSTHYRCQLSFMYWLCSKQNCLLCAYEHHFGDSDKITIV